MKTLRKYKMLSFTLLIFAFMLNGCNKDKEDEISKTELLSRTWSVTTVDGQPVFDYSGLESLKLEFENNGELNFTVSFEGASITLLYTWKWINNEQTIVVDDGTSSMEWDVQKLSAEELWFMDIEEQVVFKCSAI